MSGAVPEERVRRSLASQSWRRVLFLHWRVSPQRLSPLLPPGLVPDVSHDAAWVGLVAFRVEDFHVWRLPLPLQTGRYPETNVRTYVRPDDDTVGGPDGVWFFSLDVDSAATVCGARPTLGVPYRWAEMTVEEDGMMTRYVSRRRRIRGRGPSHRISAGYHPAALSPDDLDGFLTGRWRAFTRRLGKLVTVPVEHQAWELHEATLSELHQTLLRPVGIEVDQPPDHARWSPGVDARLGWPRLDPEHLQTRFET
jgi:uncharacterized protein YqjF (DUF2071 family)